MNKLTLSVLLLFSATTYAQSISPEEAKKLADALANSKKDTSQINILLKLAKYHVFKPGENKTDLDSANHFINKAERLNSDIKSSWASGYILLDKSYLLRESGENEKAKEAAGQAVDILKNSFDKLLAGDAYFEYSSYFDIYQTKSLAERIKIVDTAVSYFDQSGDKERLGASLHMLGDLHQINGSDFIALRKLQLALDAYSSVHHDAVQGIYSLIGRIYNMQRDYKKALDNHLLALKTAEAVGDNSSQMCMIYNNIGEAFFQLGEKEKAIDYYDRGLDVAKKSNDNAAIYTLTAAIAVAWISLNKPHFALRILDSLSKRYIMPNSLGVDFLLSRTYIRGYSGSKEYAKAQPYVDHLINLVNDRAMNDYTNLYAYAEIIRFYIASGQYRLATEYLTRHKALAEKVSDILEMGNTHKFWFMLDTSEHNYQSAVDHLLRFKKLNDSLFNETKSEQLSELQVQYETEKKDQNIKLLTKQDELQKSKLQQSAILRDVSFAVVALLIIIVALLYNRYRLKQKTNKKLEFQQHEIAKSNLTLLHLVDEKDWLLKETHHRVKNNLQIVMSLLNSQSKYIDNESAIAAIHDSQHRVHAMSLIHQKLYNTENVSCIDMSVYIRELASYLADSFNTGQTIHFEFAVEPLEMDVSMAVPLGLILNEAITNSIKYAFPNGANGVISISLSTTTPQHYLLCISDNGIGIPTHVTKKKFGSLGMSLMAGLSAQLRADFSIEKNNGTVINLSFVHDAGVKRPDKLDALFVSNN